MSPAEAEVEDEAPAYLSPAVAAVLAEFRASGRDRKPLKPIRDPGCGSARWPAPPHRPAEQEFDGNSGRAVLRSGHVWTPAASILWERIGELDRPTSRRRGQSWQCNFVGETIAPPWGHNWDKLAALFASRRISGGKIDLRDPRLPSGLCLLHGWAVNERRPAYRDAGRICKSCSDWCSGHRLTHEARVAYLVEKRRQQHLQGDWRHRGEPIWSPEAMARSRRHAQRRLVPPHLWWVEDLMQEPPVPLQRPCAKIGDRGRPGERAWGGRDHQKDDDLPVFAPPRILAGLLDRGLPSSGRSRATTKRWVRPGLVRITHPHTVVDDPRLFRLAAVPVFSVDDVVITAWMIADPNSYGSLDRRGWPAGKWKSYPPVSLNVPDDEGGPRLTGLASTVDYVVLVASDLRDVATSHLSLGLGIERRPVDEQDEMHWGILDGPADEEARRRLLSRHDEHEENQRLREGWKRRAGLDAERALRETPIQLFVMRNGALTFERLIMPNRLGREVITTTVTGPALLTVHETAQVIGIPRTTVGDLIQSGELRAVRIGGDKRIEAAEVARWLRRLEADEAASSSS